MGRRLGNREVSGLNGRSVKQEAGESERLRNDKGDGVFWSLLSGIYI